VTDDTSNAPAAGDLAGADEAVERLARALEDDALTPATLREGLGDLVAQLQAVLESRFEEARARAEQAEAKLVDQSARLSALGSGRERTMLALNEARAELARVSAERDQLLKQLVMIDGMQSDTVALTEDWEQGQVATDRLPTIEELMANLSSIEEDGEADARETDGEQGQEPQWQEMIAPELIFTDDGDDEREQPPAETPGVLRMLVSMDTDPPLKYPLHKSVVTIGRSDAADITVQGDSISRIHARIVCDESGLFIEDAGSKNGVKVNAQHAARRVLRHGDIVALGKHRFTLIDTTTD
jgi:hypothetical protein